MEQGRGNGPTREERIAEDMEWNVALADLIRGIEQAKGAIERVDLAVQRVRIAGQRRHDRDDGGSTVSETEQARRGELTHRAHSWLVICADPTCSHAFYASPRMTKRAFAGFIVHRGWRKVGGLYRCPEHVQKEQAA